MVIKMKKKIGKLASLVVVASLVLTAGVAISSERVNIRVEGHIYSGLYTGEWHVYPEESIQDAIDNASEGDTVYVHADNDNPYTYIENVKVNKRLTLIGDDRDLVTIEAPNEMGHVFMVTTNEVVITGFTAAGTQEMGKAGIWLQGVSSCNISNNRVTGNKCHGIFLKSSNNNIVANNDASNQFCGGIKLSTSDNNIITGNTMRNNGHMGLFLMPGSDENLIYNNYFYNPGSWGNAFDNNPFTNKWSLEEPELGTNIVGGPYLGGNYFSDYLGEDADGNGIGDIAYEIKNREGKVTNKDNLSLVRYPISCDVDGNEKNEFKAGEDVYVKSGGGFEPGAEYKIWIQDDPVIEGDSLDPSEDPSGSQESITIKTDGTGGFDPILIWSIPKKIRKHTYDIVIDKQNDGESTGIYNNASDGIDGANGGFVTPKIRNIPIPLKTFDFPENILELLLKILEPLGFSA